MSKIKYYICKDVTISFAIIISILYDHLIFAIILIKIIRSCTSLSRHYDSIRVTILNYIACCAKQ